VTEFRCCICIASSNQVPPLRVLRWAAVACATPTGNLIHEQTSSLHSQTETRFSLHTHAPCFIHTLGTFSINTLWRILLLGSVVGPGLPRRATESDFNSLHTELASFESDSQSIDPRRVSLLMKNVLYRLHRARLIITTNGWLGMVPRDTQIGDEIYVLASGRMPFLLRASQERFSLSGASNAQRSCHTLVGECYLDGSMDGELSVKLRDEAVDVFIV
jgi:hypothetical protein